MKTKTPKRVIPLKMLSRLSVETQAVLLAADARTQCAYLRQARAVAVAIVKGHISNVERLYREQEGNR